MIGPLAEEQVISVDSPVIVEVAESAIRDLLPRLSAEAHIAIIAINDDAALGALALLRRLIEPLNNAFPKTPLLIRLDGGFATPEILDYLDAQAVEYVVAMAGNSVLKRFAEPLMKQARRRSEESGQTEHLYGECRYAARS